MSTAVEKIFLPFDVPGEPGATVLLMKEENVQLMRAYGQASLEHHRGVTVDTPFRISSMGKSFTAVAIALVLEKFNLYTFGSSLGEILPRTKGSYLEKITLRQLLTHTSGLQRSYVDGSSDRAVFEELLESGPSSETLPPGKYYRYSNAGFAILGVVIQSLTEQTYASFLQEEIFTPLNLRDSHVYAPVKNFPTFRNQAFGYRFMKGKWHSLVDAGGVVADGGVWTSTRDMKLWIDFWNGNHADPLLDSASLKELHTPLESVHHLTKATVNYGFGWRYASDGLSRSHGGATLGFKSYMESRSDGVSIVVLTNRSDLIGGSLQKYGATQLAQRALEAMDSCADAPNVPN